MSSPLETELTARGFTVQGWGDDFAWYLRGTTSVYAYDDGRFEVYENMGEIGDDPANAVGRGDTLVDLDKFVPRK